MTRLRTRPERDAAGDRSAPRFARLRSMASPLVCAIVVACALAAAAVVDHDVTRLGLTLAAFVALLGCNPPNELPGDSPRGRHGSRLDHESVSRPLTHKRSSLH